MPHFCRDPHEDRPGGVTGRALGHKEAALGVGVRKQGRA